MEDTQPRQSANRPEVREYKRNGSRHSAFRIPFGFLIGVGLLAVMLQWTGTVNLGLPIGPNPFGAKTETSRPGSVASAQADLRDVVRSAASLVNGPGDSRPQTAVPTRRGSSAPDYAAGAGGPGADEAALDEISESTHAALDSTETQAAAAPPTTLRSDGYRSEIEKAWFSGGSNPATRALHARTRALQLGAANYDAASRALLSPAAKGARLEQAMLAVRLSPDLPLARMELASALFGDGQYLESGREVVAGIAAIPRNLEATLWLAASLLAMFAAVLTIGSLAFIVWVGVSTFQDAAHDVGDLVSRSMPEFARVALLGSLLLVPVLLGEAAMGIVLGLFGVGFAYCEAGYRRALALAAVLLVLGLYPVTRLAGMALTALDSDPVATAADAVVRGTATLTDIETLSAGGAQDWLAASALALHERRAGDPAAARARYEQLLEQRPSDPFVLVALSNMYFEQGDAEKSIQLGERAAAVTRSATLLFNLSQVYARSFRMDEFEGAMAQAQAVDATVVADLSRTKAPDFVADLPFPAATIRDRMVQSSGGDRFIDPVSRVLMPGRIGDDWQTTAGAFAAAAVLGLLLGGRWQHASSCSRCGRRICGRCDGSVWNNQICDGCHHLFHRPESTDPAMRMARLSELRARETRIGRVVTAASLLVPGVAGLLARRPDLSFLGLFFFAWAVLLIVWRNGVVVDPLAIGAAGPLLFVVAGVASLLAYALVVSLGLMIRRNL